MSCTLKYTESINNIKHDLTLANVDKVSLSDRTNRRSIIEHNKAVMDMVAKAKTIVDKWSNAAKRFNINVDPVLKYYKPFQGDIDNPNGQRILLDIRFNKQFFDQIDQLRKSLGIYESKQSLSDYYSNNRDKVHDVIGRKNIKRFNQELTSEQQNIIKQLTEQDIIDNYLTKEQKELWDKLKKLYPELKIEIVYDNQKAFARAILNGRTIFNQKNETSVDYTLKAVEILSSDKAKKVFEEGAKKGWDLERILNELEKSDKKQGNISEEEQAIRQELNKVNKELGEEFKKKENKDNRKIEQLKQRQIELKDKLENVKEQPQTTSPRVILTVGASGSGKSTWIKSLPKDIYTIISPDKIRKELTGNINNKSKDEEIYKLAHKRIAEAINNGKQVIFDTTNLKKSRREQLYREVRALAPNVEFQYKKMDLVEPKVLRKRIIDAIAKGEKRADVPIETLQRHYKSFKQAEKDLKNENITEFANNTQTTTQNTTIPKAQKELILEKGLNNREEIIAFLLVENSFTVEINLSTNKSKKNSPFSNDIIYNGYIYQHIVIGNEDVYFRSPTAGLDFQEDISKSEYDDAKANGELVKNTSFKPTQHYKNLSARQKNSSNIKYNSKDWSYQELEIRTPNIIPNIKGHADFSTDNGIGWFRIWTNDKTGEVEVQEIQSDLFQKGRNKKGLIKSIETRPDVTDKNVLNKIKILEDADDTGFGIGNEITIDGITYERNVRNGNWRYKDFQTVRGKIEENQFLQLLNKKSAWVNFFIQSIVQDSAKKGYKTIRFPLGETAAKIEGHDLIADRIKEIDKKIDEIKHNEKYGGEFQVEVFFEGQNLGNDAQGYRYEINSGKDPDGFISSKLAITNLEKQKQDLKTQGLEKLAPIEHFYENVVSKKVKQFYSNVKEVTDEEGNKWLEVDISKEENKSKNILLQRKGNKIAGQANIEAMSILLDTKYIDETTIPHEFAHFYIEWNKNTEIVKEALNKWATKGKELNYDKEDNIIEDENYVEAVENLVQAIAEQSVKQKGDAWNWWTRFLKWISFELSKLDKLDKVRLKNILTDAFLNREDLQVLNKKLLNKEIKAKSKNDIQTISQNTIVSEPSKQLLIPFSEYSIETVDKIRNFENNNPTTDFIDNMDQYDNCNL